MDHGLLWRQHIAGMIVLHILYCLISHLVSLQLTLPAGGSFSRSRQHRLLRERPGLSASATPTPAAVQHSGMTQESKSAIERCLQSSPALGRYTITGYGSEIGESFKVWFSFRFSRFRVCEKPSCLLLTCWLYSP